MRVTLSEIELTVAKAAKGVGLPLGLGEDAGLAARHMAVAGCGAMAVFADALESVDRKVSTGFVPEHALAGAFVAADGAERLSALWAGPSACDLLVARARGEGVVSSVTLAAVDAPAVVVFEALVASGGLDRALSLRWRVAAGGETEVVLRDGALFAAPGTPPDLSAPGPADLSIALADPGTADALGALPKDDRVLQQGATIEAETWRRVTALAARLLVEATETSRMAGAGAGLVDTD